MSEDKFERRTLDLVTGGLGVAVGAFVPGFFSSTMSSYLHSLTLDTYLVVLAVCVLVMVTGGMISSLLGRLLQFAGGVVFGIALVGVMVSRMP